MVESSQTVCVRKLAEVGMRWWADVTHEEGKRWLTWGEAKRRYPELGTAKDKSEYARLIAEMSVQEGREGCEWFKGKYEPKEGEERGGGEEELRWCEARQLRESQNRHNGDGGGESYTRQGVQGGQHTGGRRYGNMRE